MNDVLNRRQAYLAMYAFFEQCQKNRGDELGGLLGSMSLLPNGSTADSRIWDDWLGCIGRVNEVRTEDHKGSADDTYSYRYAYLAMLAFVNELYSLYSFEELCGLLGSMQLMSDGSTADPTIWHEWWRCAELAQAGKVDARLRFID